MAVTDVVTTRFLGESSQPFRHGSGQASSLLVIGTAVLRIERCRSFETGTSLTLGHTDHFLARVTYV